MNHCSFVQCRLRQCVDRYGNGWQGIRHHHFFRRLRSLIRTLPHRNPPCWPRNSLHVGPSGVDDCTLHGGTSRKSLVSVCLSVCLGLTFPVSAVSSFSYSLLYLLLFLSPLSASLCLSISVCVPLSRSVSLALSISVSLSISVCSLPPILSSHRVNLYGSLCLAFIISLCLSVCLFTCLCHYL